MRVVIARSLRLRIRLVSDSDCCQSLEITADKTVKELKHVMKTTLLQEKVEPGDRLRLISAGRALKDTETLEKSGVRDNAVVDCVITKFDVLTALASEPRQDEANSSNVLRGFDRLQSNGFSEDEVVEIRGHFSSEVSNIMERLSPLENESEQRFRAEEEWLRTHSRQVGLESANLPSTTFPTERVEVARRLCRCVDVLVGFSIGCFFGFLMLFLVADPNRPLTKSCKFGIILGIFVNTALQFWDPTTEVLSTETLLPSPSSQERFFLNGQVMTGNQLRRGDVSDIRLVVPVEGAMGQQT